LTIRTFIAIDVDDREVISKITRFQEELASSSSKLKLVEPENVHLTIKFLGNVEEHRLPHIYKVIDEISRRMSPFEMVLSGVGSFPSATRPRVIWVGIKEGFEEALHLIDLVESSLARLGFSRERRKPQPHVTVARVKYSSNDLERIISKFTDVEFGRILVKEVKVKKSTLTPKGPIYEDLYVSSLGVSD